MTRGIRVAHFRREFKLFRPVGRSNKLSITSGKNDTGGGRGVAKLEMCQEVAAQHVCTRHCVAPSRHRINPTSFPIIVFASRCDSRRRTPNKAAGNKKIDVRVSFEYDFQPGHIFPLAARLKLDVR